ALVLRQHHPRRDRRRRRRRPRPARRVPGGHRSDRSGHRRRWRARRRRHEAAGPKGDVSLGGWWRAAATVALAAACYGNTLLNDFVWDDRLSAVAAADVGTVLKQRTGPYYRPVVMFSFLVDRAAWGTSAFGFHLTNLLAHAGVGFLVGELALVLGATPGAALAASLLFVAHPVQTEAVSYVSGRTDVLCALFVLGALLVWRRARRAADGWAIASAALVLAALGCKE